MKIDTVIFDFDGTLANSVDLILRLYNEHAAEYGYEVVHPSEFSVLRRMGYKKAMKAKGVKFSHAPKIAMRLSREMRQRMHEVKPYDGVVEALNTLQKQGYAIGVLTSNHVPLVLEFLSAHAFPTFDFVVSEKSIFGKDRALKRIIKKYHLARDQVMYVGDEPRDVAACRKAKVAVIGVTWGIGGKEGFEALAPDYMADTPQALLDAIVSYSTGDAA